MHQVTWIKQVVITSVTSSGRIHQGMAGCQLDLAEVHSCRKICQADQQHKKERLKRMFSAAER
jgi:hypothetical protein